MRRIERRKLQELLGVVCNDSADTKELRRHPKRAEDCERIAPVLKDADDGEERGGEKLGR